MASLTRSEEKALALLAVVRHRPLLAFMESTSADACALRQESPRAVRSATVSASRSAAPTGVLLCAPRIIYAMAADGLVSRRVSFVDAGGTPVVALILSTVASLLMLVSGSFEFIATVGASFAVASYSGGFIALLLFRATEPELPRPFPSWGHPWTTLLVLSVSLALMGGTIAGAPRESLVAVAALAVAYPLFRLTRK